MCRNMKRLVDQMLESREASGAIGVSCELDSSHCKSTVLPSQVDIHPGRAPKVIKPLLAECPRLQPHTCPW